MGQELNNFGRPFLCFQYYMLNFTDSYPSYSLLRWPKNLLKNHGFNFNQTWHYESHGKGDLNFFKNRVILFFKGRLYWNRESILTKFKFLPLPNHWPYSTKLGTNHLLLKRIQVFQMKSHTFFKWEIIVQ